MGERAECCLLFDKEDLKLQKFFQGGRYPDEGDLVNVYHALTLLAEKPEPATIDQILACSPLPKSRTKVCLSLFANRRIIKSEPGGRYRLIKPNLSRSSIARVGQSYQERHERDLLRQRLLEEFADTYQCRWHRLLDYFGHHNDELNRCELSRGESSNSQLASGEIHARCGHCDNCRT